LRKEISMNKLGYLAILALMIGLSFYPVEGRAQGYGYGMGPGMMGPGYGYGYGMGPGMTGPGYGYGYHMGPGMMGPGYGYGYGMGPGMMGPGYGYGYGMGPGMMGPGYGYQYGPQYQQPQKSLDEKDAKTIMENYLKSTRNPNLKLGKIEDKGRYFEAEILTLKDSLVDKILVDKNTGWMRSAY
jgi:hypothetical protein